MEAGADQSATRQTRQWSEGNASVSADRHLDLKNRLFLPKDIILFFV